MLLVRLRPTAPRSQSLVVITAERAAKQATVEAIGPEVRDVRVGDVVIINAVAGMAVGDSLLVPETAVVGTL